MSKFASSTATSRDGRDGHVARALMTVEDEINGMNLERNWPPFAGEAA